MANRRPAALRRARDETDLPNAVVAAWLTALPVIAG
jgi:hypothetical protein